MTEQTFFIDDDTAELKAIGIRSIEFNKPESSWSKDNPIKPREMLFNEPIPFDSMDVPPQTVIFDAAVQFDSPEFRR